MAETITMSALVLNDYDGPLVLTEIARPAAGRGEVLVRIAASGLNPLDTKIRSGGAAHARHPVPLVLGIDMAGTVESVGEGVTAFKPGDQVYGMTGGVGGIQGSLAHYASVDADLLALKPRTISPREAAALPLAFITAYSALVDRANLQPGQSVLVHGGAGGVGNIAAQLAQALGARVFATASEHNHASLVKLGVTPIDYKTQSVDDYVREFTSGEGFDVVIDTVGGATLDASFKAVRHFGHVVSALGWGTHALAALSFAEASYSGVFALYPLLSGNGRRAHGAALKVAAQMVDEGQIVSLVDDRRFDLTSAANALDIVKAGTSRGKIVVDI
jgi:NADPH2:quinone reductase